MSALIHRDDYTSFVTRFRKLKPIDFLNEDDVLSDEQCSKKEIEANIEQLYKLINDLNEINERLEDERAKIAGLLTDLRPDLDKLKEFKNVNYLLEFLDRIKNRHIALERAFRKKKSTANKVDSDQHVLDAISLYGEMLTDLNFIIDLQASNELSYYLKRIVSYWNDYLIKKLEPIFDQCLKTIKWPATTLLNEETNYLTENTESLDKFKRFFEAYLKLDENNELQPDESTTNKQANLNLIKNDEATANQLDKIEIALPVEQLLLPFKKRFVYHFQQESKTNRLDKPEWYLTQIINWIKNHEDFLEQITDPIFRRISKNRHSTKLQFIHTLVGLVRRKMELDLTKLVYDDKLFAHLFDETLIFTNELKSFLDEGEFEIYTELNLIDLFVIEPYFSKLISLESKKTTQYIENILSNENAWNLISNPKIDENLDSFKIPNCVDKFILLLQSITDRFSLFHNLESKSSFVKLQLDSIDEFRLRLAQLTNNPLQEDKMKWPFYSNYYAILNSLNYLIIVLEDWKYQAIFMEISEYLLVDSVFDEILGLLNHLLNEMIQKIILSLMNQLRVKIHQYTKIKWFCLNEDDQELTYASHELFFLISSALDLLKRQISENLFEKLIRIITSNLNNYFINDFILKCTFNDYGVRMLNENLNTNLIPIFKNFFNVPDDKFIEILDCCTLLSLDKEANEQLKKTYDQTSLDEYGELPTNEFNANSLDPNLTIEILNRRLFF